MDTWSFKKKIFLVITGIFLCLILLEIGLRLGGFVFLSLQEYKNSVSVRQRGTYRILCLGDSSTFLQWPHLLEGILNQKNTGIKFSVIDKGIPASNSTVVISQLENNLNKYSPDMVIAMMGINDGVSTELFRNNSSAGGFKSFLRNLKLCMWGKVIWSYIAGGNTGMKAYDAIISKEGDMKHKEAMRTKSEDAKTCIDLGEYYRVQGRYDEAEQKFREAISINPENDTAYYNLGLCYYNQGKYDKADEIFREGIKVNPGSEKANLTLALIYLSQREYGRAVELLKDIIRINPGSSDAYVALGECYYSQEKYYSAEEALKKASEIMPGNDEIYFRLALCYKAQGKYELAKENFKKTENLRSGYYNPVTYNNYQKLYRMVNQRGIKLVCVQYPMRSIKPLRNMFKQKKGIIFVDNEIVFKKALETAAFEEYFMDRYAGDFGHCTPKGNRLLAENIANVLLKVISK